MKFLESKHYGYMSEDGCDDKEEIIQASGVKSAKRSDKKRENEER